MVEIPKQSVPKLEETVTRLRQSLAAAETNLYAEYDRVAAQVGLGTILQEVFGTKSPLMASGNHEYTLAFRDMEYKELVALHRSVSAAERASKLQVWLKTERYSVVVGYGDEDRTGLRPNIYGDRFEGSLTVDLRQVGLFDMVGEALVKKRASEAGTGAGAAL